MKVVTQKSEDKKKLKEIYAYSFPEDGVMFFWLMCYRAKRNKAEFLSFHDGDLLCGFVYMVTIEKITYLLFFAVDRELRSKGYGSLCVDKIQELHPNNKIITYIDRVDLPEDDLENRIRRKEFYLRNGFRETGYFIDIQQRQELLIKNGGFDANEFIEFYKKYSKPSTKPSLVKKVE